MENRTEAKNTKKVIIVVILALVLFGAYGYYDIVLKKKINGTTLIDNPTDGAITVLLDSKKYEVTAHQYVEVKDITLGYHTLSCEQSGIKNEKFNIDPVAYGVINPTRSKYVIYNMIYTQKDLSSQFKPYKVEGREIFSLAGAPEVLTDLFIPDRTSGKGNIDDKEPDTQSYNSFNQDYSVLSKIFRLSDFFEYYDKANKGSK
ncbi:hypothetical protein [Mucilaginibacter sp.]|uniref:hypothetical protein n=1 Tax=Mucilaginibacter sp. TaxID=1882438 RepID=UPI002606E2BC|nr:hypothetical protein [Mucilaginibacter sp.]MDB4924543.1 hypothetical protein [Mucilaginibacter sp.]